MNQQLLLTGIVISEYPMGENDKRLTILTGERGKVSVISKGCRKVGSHLHAVSQAITFGEFQVSFGRNYNYLTSAVIKDSFGYLKDELKKILYASYFCEVTGYFAVEGQEERDLLNLLFITFMAMKKALLPLPLIRRIFEFRILQYSGYGMETNQCIHCGRDISHEVESGISYSQGGIVCHQCKDQIFCDPVRGDVAYALSYLSSAPLKETYSFVVSGKTQEGFERAVSRYFSVLADHNFKSEVMLETV